MDYTDKKEYNSSFHKDSTESVWLAPYDVWVYHKY